jgi:hypothetical protein
MSRRDEIYYLQQEFDDYKRTHSYANFLVEELKDRIQVLETKIEEGEAAYVNSEADDEYVSLADYVALQAKAKKLAAYILDNHTVIVR